MLARFLSSSALVCVIASPAFAQEDFDLGTLILSASLSAVEAGKTGATVEALDAEDLEASGPDFVQTLATLPGVSLSANGGFGTSANLRVRGLDGVYLGVRINGIEVSDVSSLQAAYSYGGLMPFGFDHVELLKGSQSALYGSEAIAGVLSLETGRPTKDGFSGKVHLEYGSYETIVGNVSLAYADDKGEITFSYTDARSAGFSTLAADSEADGYTQKNANLTLRYNVSDALSLGAAVLVRDDVTDYDTSFDPSRTLTSHEFGARVFAELETGRTNHVLSYSVYEKERLDPEGFTTRFVGNRKKLDYLATIDLGANSQLDAGFDYVTETATSDATVNSIVEKSLFAEYRTNPLDGLDLSLAARLDHHSDFGTMPSYRAALVYDVSDATSLRAVIGTGFRAPSLYELYGPYGNPGMEPETSKSFELGLERRFDNGSIDATLFYTKIDNLIGWDDVLSSYNQVDGETISKGLELSGAFEINERVTLFGNYTYTDAREDGDRAVRVPAHDFVFGVKAALSQGIDLSAEIQHVADVVPSGYAPAGHKVGDYTLVNLSVSKAISDTAEGFVRVHNLFDADYETAGGYNQSGRAIYAGIRTSF